MIDELLRSLPIATRLGILNEMMLINMLVELGYREDRPWAIDEKEELENIIRYAKRMTKDQINEFEQWEKDNSQKHLKIK